MYETKETVSDGDTLGSVVWAGATQVASALDRVLGGGVRIVRAEPVSFGALVAPEVRAAAVAFDLSGGLAGTMVHIVDDDTARRLVARLLGHAQTVAGAYDTSDRGALSEIGNIAASAFLNALADHLGRACLPSVPRFVHGTTGELLGRALRGADGRAPHADTLVLVVQIEAEDGRLLLVAAPDQTSLQALRSRAKKRRA